MICRYDNLRRYPTAFLKMTGLRLNEFADLLDDMLPRFASAEQTRLRRADRRRAIGGGRQADLAAPDQILLAVLWLGQYPTNQVLGLLFGVSDSTVSRRLGRLLPLLSASGKDSMRMPDPGRKHRNELDVLLAETPQLAVIIDRFEQRVQRSKDRAEADAHFSGKKKQHTLNGQVAVDVEHGTVCDVPDSVPGPRADLTVVKDCKLLERLPEGCRALGDLAYVGIAALHAKGLAATPRRRPRGKDRRPDDVEFNRAFAKRRIKVEHTINRLRR